MRNIRFNYVFFIGRQSGDTKHMVRCVHSDSHSLLPDLLWGQAPVFYSLLPPLWPVLLRPALWKSLKQDSQYQSVCDHVNTSEHCGEYTVMLCTPWALVLDGIFPCPLWVEKGHARMSWVPLCAAVTAREGVEADSIFRTCSDPVRLPVSRLWPGTRTSVAREWVVKSLSRYSWSNLGSHGQKWASQGLSTDVLHSGWKSPPLLKICAQWSEI